MQLPTLLRASAAVALLTFLAVVLYLVLDVQLLSTDLLCNFCSTILPIRTTALSPLVYFDNVMSPMPTIFNAVLAEELTFREFSDITTRQADIVFVSG